MDLLPPDEILYQYQHINDDRAPGVIASQVICFTLACAAVLLRWISRRMCKAGIGADDYMIVVALILALGYMIVIIQGLQLGLGKHAILLKDVTHFYKLVFSIGLIYITGIAALKFSILLFYQRLFAINRKFKIACWGLAIFILCYTVVGIFLSIFQFSPVKGSWDVTINAVENIDTRTLTTILASLNVVSDFLTLALPVALVLRLKIPTKQKVQLMLVFLLGGCVCICSIVRASLIHKMSFTDPTWSDADPASWSMAELGIGIVGACLPTMRPLLRKYNGSIDVIPSYGRISKGSNDMEKNLSQSTQNEPLKLLPVDLGASHISTSYGSGGSGGLAGSGSFEQTPRAVV